MAAEGAISVLLLVVAGLALAGVLVLAALLGHWLLQDRARVRRLQARLEDERAELDHQRAALDQHRAEVERTLAQWQAELADIELRAETLAQESDAREAELERLEQLLAQLRQDCAAAETDQANRQEDLERIAAEVAACVAQYDRMLAQREALEAESATQTAAFHALRQAMTALSGDHEALSGDISKLVAHRDRLLETLDDLQRDTETWQAELRDAQTQARATAGADADALAETVAQRTALLDEINALNAERDAAAAELAQIRDERQAVHDAAQAHAAHPDAPAPIPQSPDGEAARLEWEQEKTRLAQEMATLQDALARLGEERDQEIAALREELTRLTAEREQTAAPAAPPEEARELQLQDDLARLVTERDLAQQAADDARAAAATAQAEAEAAQAARDEALADIARQRAAVMEEVAAMLQQGEQSLAAQDEALAEVTFRRDVLAEDVTRLRAEQEELNARQPALQARTMELEAERDHRQHALAALTLQFETLEARIATLAGERDKFDAARTEAEHAAEATRREQSQREDALVALAGQQEALRAEIAALIARRDNLSGEVATLAELRDLRRPVFHGHEHDDGEEHLEDDLMGTGPEEKAALGEAIAALHADLAGLSALTTDLTSLSSHGATPPVDEAPEQILTEPPSTEAHPAEAFPEETDPEEELPQDAFLAESPSRTISLLLREEEEEGTETDTPESVDEPGPARLAAPDPAPEPTVMPQVVPEAVPETATEETLAEIAPPPTAPPIIAEPSAPAAPGTPPSATEPPQETEPLQETENEARVERRGAARPYPDAVPVVASAALWEVAGAMPALNQFLGLPPLPQCPLPRYLGSVDEVIRAFRSRGIDETGGVPGLDIPGLGLVSASGALPEDLPDEDKARFHTALERARREFTLASTLSRSSDGTDVRHWLTLLMGSCDAAAPGEVLIELRGLITGDDPLKVRLAATAPAWFWAGGADVFRLLSVAADRLAQSAESEPWCDAVTRVLQHRADATEMLTRRQAMGFARSAQRLIGYAVEAASPQWGGLASVTSLVAGASRLFRPPPAPTAPAPAPHFRLRSGLYLLVATLRYRRVDAAFLTPSDPTGLPLRRELRYALAEARRQAWGSEGQDLLRPLDETIRYLDSGGAA